MQVDRLSSGIANLLDKNGLVYAKFREVTAVQAEVSTPVETILGSGKFETGNIAHPGDWIVTNPGGERYVVKPEKFAKNYEPKPGLPGTFIPKGIVVAARSPFGTQVSMMASWGELQHGDSDCYFADQYDPSTGKREGNPRIIASFEFHQTYAYVGTR